MGLDCIDGPVQGGSISTYNSQIGYPETEKGCQNFMYISPISPHIFIDFPQQISTRLNMYFYHTIHQLSLTQHHSQWLQGSFQYKDVILPAKELIYDDGNPMV